MEMFLYSDNKGAEHMANYSFDQYIKKAMNILLKDNNFKDKEYEIMMAKSHGHVRVRDEKKYKFSFHFVVNCQLDLKIHLIELRSKNN